MPAEAASARFYGLTTMGRVDRFWSKSSGSSTFYFSNMISSNSIRDRVDEIDRFIRDAIQSRGLGEKDIEVESHLGKCFYELRLIGKGVHEEFAVSGHAAEGNRINAIIVQIAKDVEEKFFVPARKREVAELKRSD